MSKLLFNEKQINEWSGNPYVKTITSKTIDFTFEFKEHIVLECDTLQQGLDFLNKIMSWLMLLVIKELSNLIIDGNVNFMNKEMFHLFLKQEDVVIQNNSRN